MITPRGIGIVPISPKSKASRNEVLMQSIRKAGLVQQPCLDPESWGLRPRAAGGCWVGHVSREMRVGRTESLGLSSVPLARHQRPQRHLATEGKNRVGPNWPQHTKRGNASWEATWPQTWERTQRSALSSHLPADSSSQDCPGPDLRVRCETRARGLPKTEAWGRG